MTDGGIYFFVPHPYPQPTAVPAVAVRRRPRTYTPAELRFGLVMNRGEETSLHFEYEGLNIRDAQVTLSAEHSRTLRHERPLC
jgi:hypothetical protein